MNEESKQDQDQADSIFQRAQACLRRRDTQKATAYLHRATELGHVPATRALGQLLHSDGNFEPAYRMFELSATDDAHAAFMMGRMVMRGEGVAADADRAVSLFRDAAERGHADAQYNLGKCYQHGNGVEKNPGECIRYFHSAMGQRHAEAAFQMGKMHHAQDQIEKAVECYQVACDQNHAVAQLILGEIYNSGQGGIPRNRTKALKLFETSAKLGCVEAQANLLRELDLNRLQTKEFHELSKEICGFSDAFQETPDSIGAKLMEFQKALDRIPDKPAYNKARLMDSEYVQNRTLQLMALRADNFDVPKAARRYAKYFEYKLALFGLDRLARQITQDDFDDDDRATIDAGFIQFLPQRDSAGRLIVVMSQEHQVFPTYQSLLRTSFYIAHHERIVSDEISQSKGMVLVVYNVDLTRPDQLFRDQMRHGDRHLKSSLSRFSAIHYCYSDARLQPAVAIFQIVLGRAIRLRICTHLGSHMECRYKLGSYGIPVDSFFPIDLSGKLIVDYHRRFLAESAEAERRRINDTTKINVTSKDVLFGRGRGVLTFPGNQALIKLVSQHLDMYNRATRLERCNLSSQLVVHVQRNGGRFLMKQSETWRLATAVEARQKVGHSFRNFRQRGTPMEVES